MIRLELELKAEWQQQRERIEQQRRCFIYGLFSRKKRDVRIQSE